MDLEQKRVQDDLRGILGGDVVFGDLYAQMYATDASIYQDRPFGVVRPRGIDDVVAVVRYAIENQLEIHARGAGSGLAGESLGNGIVLDFSRYMRRIRHLDAQRVRVQPGAVLASLNRELSIYNRRYGPDPATRSVTTMGSVIAQDASGSHYLRYGSARSTVESVQVVTGTGEVLELGEHCRGESGTAGQLATAIGRLADRYCPPVETPPEGPLEPEGPQGFSPFSEPFLRHRGGYAIAEAVQGEQVHLGKLIAGSEGTLALITDATLRTEPLPHHRGVALLFFRRLEAAARGALLAAQQGAVACDLMDRRTLEIARETDRQYDQLIPREAEAMVLAELQGDGLPELRDRLRALASEIGDRRQLAFALRMTTERDERDFYWRLCRRVIPRLYRLKGNSRPLPFVEDMAVPANRLPEFLLDVQEVLKKHHVTSTIFAHAGHGQLHLRPFLDLANVDDQRRMVPLAEDLFVTLQKHQGIVCSEHAAGRSRTALLRRQLGPLWPAMLEIKRMFDPHGILNSGSFVTTRLPRADEHLRPVTRKIKVLSSVPAEEPPTNYRTAPEPPSGRAEPPSGRAEPPSGHAEPPSGRVPDRRGDEVAGESRGQEEAASRGTELPTLSLIQHWPDENSIDRAARQCNGCGRCRSTAPNERMCPMFRVLPAEEATPRAKANLMRGVITGDLAPETLYSDELKQVADLCFHCHQCRLECPASVDIPKIASEMKGQYVATNGLPLSDLWFCRLDTIAALLGKSPRLANWMMTNGPIRWLLERTIGLTRARRLPLYANRTFMRYAIREKLTRMNRTATDKVVYFVDHYANYHDPQLGKALVEIMRHNNIEVYVPSKQIPCGMPQIAAGDLKSAKKRAQHNSRILADAIRAGYTVVATEPTAALCLRHEYRQLLDNEDTRLVAEHTFEACRFLWDRHCRNQLALDFRPVPAQVAYHQPCHVRAIDAGAPGPRLMGLLPRLTVEELEQGCTGMAGTWGLQKKNYRNSLRIGWPLLSTLRKSPVRMASTECSACKMQMEHGSGVKTLHPIKLIAYAYGKLPELGAAIGAR